MIDLRNKLHLALPPVFLLALWIPAICGLLGYDPIPRPNENRPPAQFPAWPNSAATLQKFPSAFEAYYNDHFGGRNSLVYFYMWAKSVVLRVSPSPIHVLGKEDWSYLGHDQQLAASRGTRLFTEDELEQQLKTLKNYRDIADKYGAKFLVTYGPDKSTIYPEYAPAWLHRVGAASNLGQVIGYTQAHSNVAILDLRPVLEDAKSTGLIYLHSNSHWNNVGGYAAYHAMADYFVRWMPRFRPVQPDDLIFETRARNESDLEAEIDIDYFKAAPVEDARLRTRHATKVADDLSSLGVDAEGFITENEDSTLPKLVIFHDSFGWALAPFLMEGFSRVVFVRKPTYSEEVIAAERPDCVVFMRVERFLTPVKATQ